MKKIEIADLYEYKYISNLTYSDDGKNCVFVLSNQDKENNSYNSNLYQYKNGKVKQLTSLGKESSFVFINNKELYLLTSRSEKEKKDMEAFKQVTPVYKLSLEGGEAIKQFDIPLRAFNIKKLNNNELVFLGSFDKNYPDYHKLSNKEKEKINKTYIDNKDYEEIDEVPFYFNGRGYLKNKRTGLYTFNIKTKKIEKLSKGIFSVNDYEIINDRIYYSGSKHKSLRQRDDEIKYYDLKTKKTHTVLEPKYYIYGLMKFNDKLIILINRHLKHGLNENPILFKLDPKTNKLSIFNNEDRSYGNSTGSDCRYGHGKTFKAHNDKLYFLETRNYETVLAYFDEKGKVHDVFTPNGAIDDFDVNDNEIVLNILSNDSLQELYSLKNNKLKKVSSFNFAMIKNRYVAIPKHLVVKSGKYDIDGWVLYPKDFNSKKKYPAVLDIHGGPKTVYSEAFYHEMQVWASKGYFVFYCNPFGSDGKGNQFSDIRGKYGTTDYKNIMDFTDYVLKKYRNIDKDRVCVTGGSYGGFMTNWIVGHTDRFVCAATQRSISNWISFYGTSDIGVDFVKDQAGGELKDLDKIWKHSPLKYVRNVKTPILFIHSDEDYRCPLEQGMQFYTSIVKNGVDAKMVIFHGENHELSRSGKPHHRVKRLTEITNWFEKYAK